MNNKVKKLLLKVSSITLAAMLCLTSINANAIFPVNAEGEDTDITETVDNTVTDQDTQEPSEGEGEEPTTPPIEEEPEPQPGETTPTPTEEQPVQEETANSENPDVEEVPMVMSVRALDAKADTNRTSQIQIKDTDGTVISNMNPTVTSLTTGWVKESGLPEEITADGHTYTFKGVEYNGKPVLYTALYKGTLFYSVDGASGQQLGETEKLDIIYWEHFTVKMNVTNPEYADIKYQTQELTYPENSSSNAVKEIKYVDGSDLSATAVVYKGNDFNWQAAMHYNEDALTNYSIKSISVNNTTIDNSQYKSGGSFAQVIITNTTIALELGLSDKITVNIEGDGISDIKQNPDKPAKTITVTFSGNVTNKVDTIYFVKDGKALTSNPIEVNSTTSTVIEGYKITFSRSQLFAWYSYTLTIERSDESNVRSDLYFVTNANSQVSSLTTRIDANTKAATWNNNQLQSVRDKEEFKLSHFLIWGNTTITFFYKADIGYKIVNPSLDDNTGYSLENKSIDNYSNGSAKTAAIEAGYTHYVTVTKTSNRLLNRTLTFSSEIVPVKLIRTDADKVEQIAIETDITKSDSLDLPNLDDTQEQMFVGWALNDNTENNIYPGDSTFTVDSSNWSLGVDEDGTQVFRFTPKYETKDHIYSIEHYLQNIDGSYPAIAKDTLQGISPGTAGTVVGIPKEYEGYTFDAEKSADTMGLELDENGKPIGDNPVIRLYYKRDVVYTDYNISHTVKGSLGDTTKKFAFRVTASAASEGSWPTEYFEAPESGWEKDGNSYYKDYYLAHNEAAQLSKVPVNNTKYTFTHQTEDDFYTNTVSLNNQEPVKASVVHPNPEPNRIHTVEFISEATEVPATGNDFDNYAYMELLSLAAAACLLFMIIRLVRRYYI